MGQMENKFTQAATGTKNEEKEELAIEKKSAESAEASVSPEQVETFAKESEDEIAKVSENAVLEGKQAFESANQAGIKLELKKEEVDQIAEEMNVGKNLQTKEEEINAIKREAKEEISKVVEVQPESVQEEKINKVAESNEVAKENTEVAEEKPKYSEDEAREKWSELSSNEKLAYCDPKIVSKEMSDDLQLKNSPESRPFS